MQDFYCLYISVLPMEIQLSRGEGWDHINRINLAILLCLSLANNDFPCPMSLFLWVFCVLNELKSEVIVRFVDIGRIVHHHRLNYIFIKSSCDILRHLNGF